MQQQCEAGRTYCVHLFPFKSIDGCKKIAATHGGRLHFFFLMLQIPRLSHVALSSCHVIAPHLISLLWMAGKQEVAACRTVPSLPSAVAHAVHVWNLGHSADALKANETLCSEGWAEGRSKYNQAKSRQFERPRFSPGAELLLDFCSESCDVIWPGVRCEKGAKSQLEEKNLQVLFFFFMWFRAGNCLKWFWLWQMGGQCRFSDWTFSKRAQRASRHTLELKVSWPRTSLLQKELFWILKHFDGTFLLHLKKNNTELSKSPWFCLANMRFF